MTSLYESVYGERYAGSSGDKTRLQGLVYFTNEFGMSCTDRAFMWTDRGPWVEGLEVEEEGVKPVYNAGGRETLARMRELLTGVPEDSEYDGAGWVCCLAAVHYIKNYVTRSDDPKAVLECLEKRMPFLSSRRDNIRAYEAVKEIPKYPVLERRGIMRRRAI